MSLSPKVSIVMPVFNRADFLEETIESYLQQTFRDFELIIVDDGSTDKSSEILRSFSDTRIRLFTNEKNKGIVYSRNEGTKNAKGKYICPADSDDIAHREKLEKQFQFLEKNPELAGCGTRAKHIDKHSKLLKSKWKLNAKEDLIPAISVFKNYFVHSSMMLRKSILPKPAYTPGFDGTEDTKLWFDITRKHKLVIFPEYLLYYRIHPGNVSASDAHRRRTEKVMRYILSEFGLEASKRELDLHIKLRSRKTYQSVSDFKDTLKWSEKLKSANNAKNSIAPEAMKKVIRKQIIKASYKNRKYPMKTVLYLLKLYFGKI